MPSPFPGMNPYLEQADAWHDFHERFMPVAAERIASQIDPRYVVKIDEHVFIHELSADERRLLGRGDVTIASDKRRSTLVAAAAGTATADGPIEVLLSAVDEVRLDFIEIRDRKNRELVTVIELLSPINKRLGPDRDVYLAKRSVLLRTGVNLVEIDLLRGGERAHDGVSTCDYCIFTSRRVHWPSARVRPLSLAERLPIIPIPLLPPDPDAQLDLQEIVNAIYDAARYVNYIYEGHPDPPLSDADAAWAQQFTPEGTRP